MTKVVRVENADSGTSFSVIIEVYDKNNKGEDYLIDTIELLNPTQQVDLTLWQGKKLVIYDKYIDKN